jgi:hypothetical protein
MARKTRYTVKDFEEHIIGSGGIISTIAARVGCHRDTCSRWIENSPTLKALFEAELEAGLDAAESVVKNNIKAAAAAQEASGYTEIVDSSDARWLLARLGKKRGYGDSQEITGAGGGPIEIAAQVMSAIDKVYGENDEDGS